MLKRILDPFILLILLMITLAWLYPPIGLPNSWFDPSEVANWGVVGVFFFYGLKLNGQKLKAGLSNVKLHIVVQIATFVVFPLVTLLTLWLLRADMNDPLWLGVFFVAALPSTVSSSVVMVSIAKGNVPAAIFDASISSLIGIFVTPLWMSLYLTADMGAASLGDVLIKLLVQVVVPVGLGIAFNRKWGSWADSHRVTLRWFDQGVILLIVYTAFCEGFEARIFDNLSFVEMIILCFGMMALFFMIYYLIKIVSKLLSFNRQDTITALFCGSKKSLVHATVMSAVLIDNPSSAGLLLLPIMIYHALQLLIVSFIAR